MENKTLESLHSLWEVFLQADSGDTHSHVGSVRASDAEMAMQNARDVYARRGKVCSLWVIPSEQIVASQPEDAGPFFDPAVDKIYRNPQFYTLPSGMKES